MTSASLNFEVKMREIKADSEELKEAAQLANGPEVFQQNSCIKTFFGHKAPIEALDLEAPYGLLVSASSDNSFIVWDTSIYQCHAQIYGHSGTFPPFCIYQ
jgi:WD40 repeat protein